MAKVIAVTGANRGIGAAIAAELLRRGFTVRDLNRVFHPSQGWLLSHP